MKWLSAKEKHGGKGLESLEGTPGARLMLTT